MARQPSTIESTINNGTGNVTLRLSNGTEITGTGNCSERVVTLTESAGLVWKIEAHHVIAIGRAA